MQTKNMNTSIDEAVQLYYKAESDLYRSQSTLDLVVRGACAIFEQYALGEQETLSDGLRNAWQEYQKVQQAFFDTIETLKDVSIRIERKETKSV